MIPARMDSSRFPGKLMKNLGGKTIIRRTYEATLSTDLFDAVYVVTDDEAIYREINKNGGAAIYSETPHQCGSDRIAEAVENIETDIVVNVQGDEPFTSKELLEKLLNVFEQKDAENIDLTTPMIRLKSKAEIENPNNVKVITDTANQALYFSRSVIPYPRNTLNSISYYKHIGIYAFRKQALMDFYRWPSQNLEQAEKIEGIRYLEYGKHIKMVETNEHIVGIDTPEDLKLAQQYLDHQN